MTTLKTPTLRKNLNPENLYASASAQATLLELTWRIAERAHDQTPEGKAQLELAVLDASKIVASHRGEPWLLPICAKCPLLLDIHRKTLLIPN